MCLILHVGVILESEDLHRRAYNATFNHFNVQCGETGRSGQAAARQRAYVGPRV